MSAPVAIITGAGSGIGRATAAELSAKNYRIVLVGRRLEKLNQTVQLIGGGLPIVADVTKPADVERVIETTLNHFQRIDCLINNAGVAILRDIEAFSIEDWRSTIDTNLSAVFYLCKALWPTFKRQGGGVVVNVSSLAARDPFEGFAAYGAAKAGLNTFSLALSREGAKMGVRVYTVAPGAVETEMFRGIMSAEQFPPSQTLDPADVARVIGRCADGDARYTSGEVIWLRKE